MSSATGEILNVLASPLHSTAFTAKFGVPEFATRTCRAL